MNFRRMAQEVTMSIYDCHFQCDTMRDACTSNLHSGLAVTDGCGEATSEMP